LNIVEGVADAAEEKEIVKKSEEEKNLSDRKFYAS